MPADPPVTYEVPSGSVVQIPDGGRWLLVYQDGDEESTVRAENGWFRFGPTNGDWQVAGSMTRSPDYPDADRAE